MVIIKLKILKLKKIKVAHVLDSVGGVEVYLRLLTENIDSRLFENIIIHKKNINKNKYYNNSNGLIKEFNINIQREIRFIEDLKAIYNTVKILKKEKPDLIHAHSAKGGIIARAASLFYRVKVLHTPHAYSYLSANSKIKRKVFLSIESFFKNINSYLLATSNSEIERGIKEVGYKTDKTFLFNNSILPIEIKENSLDQYKLPNDYICTVGRPSFQKNIEMMIEVLKEVKNSRPNVHLVLMGVGEYSPNKESIEKLVSKYNLSNNITMIKWMDRDKILNIIAKSKLYISTSRYEGLPYSVIESLALSKASVVTNCDGNKDLIKDNVNGFVIETNDIKLMAEKICFLLQDNNTRRLFEEKSFELFDKSFNLNKNIKKLEKIYTNLVFN